MKIYVHQILCYVCRLCGFRSGLEAIGGFECVGYCEIDKYAKQAYEAMYDTGGELYFDDARKIVS